jgi:hypothetical protein
VREEDSAARELAAKTAGVLSTRLARSVGLAGHLLERRLERGEWIAATPRVLVLAGSPDTFEREAWIALHHAGESAALSHDTSLAEWRVPGFDLRPIHVSYGRGRPVEPIEGVVYHRPRLWLPHHRLTLNGLPVTTPTRALFDVANEGDLHELKLERTINNAWARRLTSGQDLAALAQEWCQRGRHGSAFLRAYLERHPIDWQPPESNLEARFIKLVVDAGMPEPVKQRNVGDHSAWIGRVDVCDPEVPLIGEIDSDLFHIAPLDQESDADRDARLTAAGFRVEHFKEFDVWHKGREVVERWRRAREIARRLRRDRA